MVTLAGTCRIAVDLRKEPLVSKTRSTLWSQSLLIIILFFATFQAVAQNGTPLNAQLDQYLTELTKNGFSGSVLLSQNGKILFAAGYGPANRELNVLNTAQTKFRLGSITKQFTAAGILILHERGQLNIQDSICKYIDGCPAAWKDVTIHHLLSHTGGVPSFTSMPDYMTRMNMLETPQSMLARFVNKPLEFAPGEKWNYSNSGYFVLGMIIEKVSHETYEAFLQKNIFTPFKLTNTGYDHFATILPNRATGYSRNTDGLVNSAFIDMSQPYAAGSLYSTVEDLFLWNEALFGGKVVTKKTFDLMTTPVKNNYGYGLGISTLFNRKLISHGGGINGFSTIIARFPNENITYVVLRNSDFGEPSPGAVGRAMAARLLGEKDEPVRPPVAKVDPAIYDKYVGEYEVTSNVILKVTRDGDHLMVQASSQSPIEILPESETKFFLKGVDARITFVKDPSGAVTHLILHQGGDNEAKKIK